MIMVLNMSKKKLIFLVSFNEVILNLYFYFLSCLVMSRDVENDDEEVDTEHEKRKRRVYFRNF